MANLFPSSIGVALMFSLTLSMVVSKVNFRQRQIQEKQHSRTSLGETAGERGRKVRGNGEFLPGCLTFSVRVSNVWLKSNEHLTLVGQSFDLSQTIIRLKSNVSFPYSNCRTLRQKRSDSTAETVGLIRCLVRGNWCDDGCPASTGSQLDVEAVLACRG